MNTTGRPLDPTSIETIKRVISRSGDPVTTFSGDRLFLAKVDVGAFPDRAFNNGEEQCVATVAGLPLLNPSREAVNSRSRDLLEICKELNRGNTNVLRDCLGPFAICYCRLPSGPLILANGQSRKPAALLPRRKGVRVLRQCAAGARALPEVSSAWMDKGLQRALRSGFPWATGRRTPTSTCSKTPSACLCQDGTVRLDSYFQWDQIEPTCLNVDDLLDRAYELFLSAVARRSADQSKVAANLSGGLDSRCIVTALHGLKKEVYVVTWATDGYLDGRLAGEYAKALRLKQIVRLTPAVPSWGDFFRCLHDLKWPGTDGPPRPNLVFSGDGGSVGVGYDYLNAECIGWMRTGQVERFVDFFLARHALPGRFMRQSIYRRMGEALCEGVTAELNRIHSHDPGRDLHIFYMKNDQRRHLYPMYENIDTCLADTFCRSTTASSWSS